MAYKGRDFSGMTFGYVTVVGRGPDHVQPSGRVRVMWKCVCGCGKEFLVRDDAVSKLTSCGCKRNKDIALRQTKHSQSRTRLYKMYYSMLGRCTVPRNSRYEMYGGRGIEVCKEWKDNFMSFYDWAISSGYDENDHRLSLERIDVDGHYCPENCKWILLDEQYDNRRNTIRMANISLARFCRELGLDYEKVLRKFKKTNDIIESLGFKKIVS
jgi:hypothetical protein